MDVLDRFATLADLDHLDDAMEDISSKRERVVLQANASTDLAHVSSGILDEISEAFILLILKVCTSHDVQMLAEARDSYGDVAVLRQLDSLVADKAQSGTDIETALIALEM